MGGEALWRTGLWGRAAWRTGVERTNTVRQDIVISSGISEAMLIRSYLSGNCTLAGMFGMTHCSAKEQVRRSYQRGIRGENLG